MRTIDVDTPLGTGRLIIDDPSGQPDAVLLLGHGAGGGIDTLDLVTLADQLPAQGIAVARYEQPWRVAGKRVAPRPAALDEGWRPALDAVLARFPGVPLVVGGRSAGARVACRCFAGPAVGVVALSFPLHPPGRPDASRSAELSAVPAPVLLISGDRDPFGSPAEWSAVLEEPPSRDRELVLVPASAHSFRTTKAPVAGATMTTAQLIPAVTARFIHDIAFRARARRSR